MNIVFCTLHVRRSLQAVPLAAGCLAAALPGPLRKSTMLVDAYPDQSDQQILSAILANTPDVIAFPVYVWNRQRVVGLASQLHAADPTLILIAGGPEATGDAARLRQEAPWTALVHGEGERAFTGLMTQLAKGALEQPPPGVTLMRPQGAMSGGQGGPGNLCEAPSPWLSGVLDPSPGVLWEVARGCVFACDYCFDARGQFGVRPLPKDRLRAELECFVAKEVCQVWVLDSTFNYPPERGIELLELLLETAPSLHYHLEAKADFLDRQTISLLGRLNCSVQIGLQSMREQVLKTIHRSLDMEAFTEVVHLLDAEGVVYGFDLIYGLPKDNYIGFRESLDAVLAYAPNHLHIFPLAILPGTRLAQDQHRYGIKAQQDPPYELIASDNWSAEDMERCRSLATAVDLFYNTGRAVAFFPAILQALRCRPSDLFEDFFKWALQQPEIDHDRLTRVGDWGPDDVYRLLQGYLCDQLRQTGQRHLVSVFLDLLCYHFNYAETLLGEELLPPSEETFPSSNLWETPWQRSHQFRLVPFAYEILDLLEMEDMQLEEIAMLFRPVGSVALFMRRRNQVFCESLGEEMLQLLQKSDGKTSPRDIFAGSVSRATGEEIVLFALSEGLLHPVVH